MKTYMGLQCTAVVLLVTLASLLQGCVCTEPRRIERQLGVISDPRSEREQFEQALARLNRMPAAEEPAFWARIVNDLRYDEDRRRECLVTLFRRHFGPGTPLNRMHEIEGTSDWFDRKNLGSAGVLQVVPLSRRHPMFAYQPVILGSTNSAKYYPWGAVYFSVSQQISPENLRQVFQGKMDGGTNVIMEMWATAGCLKPSGEIDEGEEYNRILRARAEERSSKGSRLDISPYP